MSPNVIDFIGLIGLFAVVALLSIACCRCRERIVQRWQKRKSVRAFHDQEPRPPSRSSARDVSEGRIVQQQASKLLTEVPVEVRLCIYKMAILDGSTHWHITEYRNASGDHPPSKQPRNSLWSFRSNIARMRQASVALQIFQTSEMHHHYLTPHEVSRDLLRCAGQLPRQNGLSIIRSCRQIYWEATPILYSQYRSFHGLLPMI